MSPEHRVDDTLADLWIARRFPNSVSLRLPRGAEVGRAVAMDGQIQHFLEVKTRGCASDRYFSTVVRATKHQFASGAFAYLKVPTILLVVFEDTAYTWRLNEKPDGFLEIPTPDRSRHVTHAAYAMARGERADDIFADYLAWLGELHADGFPRAIRGSATEI